MKCNYTTNKILFDWLGFSTKIDSYVDILEMMGLSDVTFLDVPASNGYEHRILFDGIKISFGGRDDTLVELSGQGCRCFETYGNGDFNRLFHYIYDNRLRGVGVNRLDVAYDDFNGLLDVEKIADDIHNFRYVSKARKATAEFFIEDKAKKIGGWCVYVGRGGSNTSIRIYDKAVERGRQDEISHWVRAEIQLRHDSAFQFISYLIQGCAFSEQGDIIADNLTLDRLYFAVINHYFRCVDCDCNDDTNMWRLPMAEHWAKFAHSVTDLRLSMYVKPGVEYNILKFDNICTQQYGAMIYTYIQLHGLQRLHDDVQFKKMKLNTKYRQLINEQSQIDREFWEKLKNDGVGVNYD